jgi:glyoxylase-like metal-dependent hydrolase (beta-lactamase superfamily II)
MMTALAFFSEVSARTKTATGTQEKIKLVAIKVSEHVYYFQGETGVASVANKGFMSNAGFVVTKGGVVVYDALATPALGLAMIEAIRHVTKMPIKIVIAGHYHADHVYGLQAFKAIGAQILAHENGQLYINSEAAKLRLAQRQAELGPWVNEKTVVVAADKWLHFNPQDNEKSFDFMLGEIKFKVLDSSGAHSAEDLMLYVENDRALFAGDLFFSGRIPFVGNANSAVWLVALEHMLAIKAKLTIPGHGVVSTKPDADIELTRSYLRYLREKMGLAVQDLQTFEEAYQQTDWTAFEKYPAFQQANRLNAFATYLLMEKESLHLSSREQTQTQPKK